MKVIDYVLKPVAFILILAVSSAPLFRLLKACVTKGAQKETLILKKDIANRPLDGTYKIVMIYYSPENRWITQNLHSETYEFADVSKNSRLLVNAQYCTDDQEPGDLMVIRFLFLFYRDDRIYSKSEFIRKERNYVR